MCWCQRCFKPQGLEAGVLQLALLDMVRLWISRPVLGEYSEVLARAKFKLDAKQVAVILAEIRRAGRVVRPTAVVAVCQHESDNRFLECADASGADYLVTGNKRHFPASSRRARL